MNPTVQHRIGESAIDFDRSCRARNVMPDKKHQPPTIRKNLASKV
jgi:hypothetical protein